MMNHIKYGASCTFISDDEDLIGVSIEQSQGCTMLPPLLLLLRHPSSSSFGFSLTPSSNPPSNGSPEPIVPRSPPLFLLWWSLQLLIKAVVVKLCYAQVLTVGSRRLRSWLSLFGNERKRPRKERKGLSITVHDLFSSLVLVASIVISFVALLDSDQVSCSNPSLCMLYSWATTSRSPEGGSRCGSSAAPPTASVIALSSYWTPTAASAPPT